MVHSSRSKTPSMATTWSDWMSCLAAAATCAGWLWSSWTKSLSGWPLTPPLALTHVKYALIMFGPSVKSVPGWWVSMVPMLIGVPVALTPALLPHDDVLTEVAALLELLGALEELPLELALLLLLELLPQPASATSATAANSTRPNRRRG